jgi:phosphonate transport system substrate-binding protein
VVMRASLPQECRDALRATLTQHSDVLWESLTSTERNADKFIERDAYMSFETDPAIYDVVRMAYEVAGIALDD